MTWGWVNNETMSWLSFLAHVLLVKIVKLVPLISTCASLFPRNTQANSNPLIQFSLFPHAWISLQAVREKKRQLACASHLQKLICCKAGALLVWNNHRLRADTPKSYKTHSLAFVHFLSPPSEGEASINTPFVPFLLNVTIINSYWRLHAPPLFFWSLRSNHVKGKMFTKYWDKYTSRVALCAIENVANNLLLPINLFVPSDRLHFFLMNKIKHSFLKRQFIQINILLSLLSFKYCLTDFKYRL